MALLAVDTATATSTQGANFPLRPVLTKVQICEIIGQGPDLVISSKVGYAPAVSPARMVTVLWGQHLSSAGARVDEIPAGRNRMPALRAPQQHTLVVAMHNVGQGLNSHVGFVL